MKTWNLLTQEDMDELFELVDIGYLGKYGIVGFVMGRMMLLNADLLQAANATKDDLGETE